MATINLREVKRRLPFGSMARIAEATGIPAHVVSRVLNHGWYPQYTSQVCDAALSILDETKIDPDVIKHAQELGVASAHSIYVPTRPKRKAILYEEPENEEPLTWEELQEMDRESLEAVIDAEDLDLDPDDYDDDDELASAIADELEIELPPITWEELQEMDRESLEAVIDAEDLDLDPDDYDDDDELASAIADELGIEED